MTKEYVIQRLFRESTYGASGQMRSLSAFRDSVTSRGLPPYRLSSGDYGLNLGGNAESLRPMYMGEDSFFISLLPWEKQ